MCVCVCVRVCVCVCVCACVCVCESVCATQSQATKDTLKLLYRDFFAVQGGEDSWDPLSL